jgi:hypothetical protein
MDKKMERMLKRHELAKEQNCEWYDILLDEDRASEAFDSQNQYNSIQFLSENDQQLVQHATQWINSFDGHNPILIATFADAFYAEQPIVLSLPIEYALCFKFAEFKAKADRKYDVTASSDDCFEVERLGLRVLNRESDRNIISTATYVRVFDGKILIASAIND